MVRELSVSERYTTLVHVCLYLALDLAVQILGDKIYNFNTWSIGFQ